MGPRAEIDRACSGKKSCRFAQGAGRHAGNGQSQVVDGQPPSHVVEHWDFSEASLSAFTLLDDWFLGWREVKQKTSTKCARSVHRTESLVQTVWNNYFT